jgi:hypothetical protein
MSLNFIKAWRNDKWYNKRVLIWCFTLVLIKINYGQIGDQTGLFYNTNPVFYTGQSVQWKPMFFRTELIFTGFVHRTDMFGNLWKCIAHRINDIHHNMYMNFIHVLIKTKVKHQIKTLLLYHLSFLHALMKFKDIDKIKSQSQKCFNERKYQYLKYKNKNHFLIKTNGWKDPLTFLFLCEFK